MELLTPVVPQGIEVTGKTDISPFKTNGKYWDIQMTYKIMPTGADNWHIQTISVTYVSFNGENIASITVKNSFALNLKGGSKIIPTSEEDFSLYADIAQTAIAQTRLMFHLEFKRTEFENEFLPLESKDEILVKVKNAVYASAN